MMSLRKAEGPLGTVDLPVPEAAPVKVMGVEAELAPEQAGMRMETLNSLH